MELTRRQATNIEAGKMPGRGPVNTFVHVRAFPDADFKMVVRPNFDTLYSSAFVDLTAEPVIVSAPDTDGRYYMLPMLDMWTDVFAAPGKRTSGTGVGHWALTRPGWRGELPDGVARIDAPTPYVWIIGRTQTDGPADYPAVHAVQDGYDLSLLSEWGQPSSQAAVTIDDSIDMETPPLDQVNAMSGPDYFALAAELMKLHRPHGTDWSVVERMRRLGLVVGESFDTTTQGPEVAKAVAAAPSVAQQDLAATLSTMAAVVNGWQINTNSIGVYGNFYAKRAIVAMRGLGANPPEDAIYPLLMADGDGNTVVGEHAYVLHFDATELPPVGAFWSVTMYDEHGFQVANELDRYAVGDRDPLRYADDGSLDLYIQHDHPGPEREANWLPAPRGPLGITMRLYAPDQVVLNGAWAPPPLRRSA
ncbi:MAG: DUF1254 domain-containing protein [Acidimicrobiales bacterium]